MLRKLLILIALIAVSVFFIKCSSIPAPVETTIGTNPTLPEPSKQLIPTVNVAKAKSWPDGTKPTAAEGLSVQEFAGELDHPRWIYVLPNNDVLVAESNSPNGLKGIKGIKGFVAKRMAKKAGAGTPSADRITLFRDADKDGVAEIRSVFLNNLTSPFGMALVNGTLYIANADAIVKLPYADGDLEASSTPQEFFPLPAGINHHWTKNIVASKDGTKLYASVGSNSNIGENGMDIEEGRAAIWEVDIATGKGSVFASGLRNPVGMDFGPDQKTLYTVVNERDELGNNLVPDYLTSVQSGGFYGWPYSYFGNIVDERVKPQKPDLVAKSIVPDYALGAHTASLGLVITDGNDNQEGNSLKSKYGAGAFIGQHGSWNRKPRSGYKVIFVPFVDGKPEGDAIDVLTGFLEGDIARGRPVGVTFDNRNALLVADDVGNNIWRVVVE